LAHPASSLTVSLRFAMCRRPGARGPRHGAGAGVDGRRQGSEGIARPAGRSGGVMAGSFDGASNCYTSGLEPSLQRGCFNQKGPIAFQALQKPPIENSLVVNAESYASGLGFEQSADSAQGRFWCRFFDRIVCSDEVVLCWCDDLVWRHNRL